MLVVANRRNQGLGRITRFWSSRVSLPSVSSTRWMTNITSGPAGVIFVEHQSHRMLQRPRQQAFAEFGHLLAVAQDDGVAADEVDAADVRVEVDADHRPVQPRRDLLDMGRLAGAVIALDHDPAVAREAGADRQRRVGIEDIGRVEVGDALVGLAERRHFHVAVDAEQARAPSPTLVGRGEHRCRSGFRG